MTTQPPRTAIVTGSSKGIGAAVAQRLGEPDDIARAISFLVGSDGGWINGQILRANGGIV